MNLQTPSLDKTVLAYIQKTIESLLRIVTFEKDKKPVKVDGFRVYTHNPSVLPQEQPGTLLSEYQTIRSVIRTEPRIVLIYLLIKSLLEVIVLESNGKVVEIDGFCLKDLKHWLIPIGDLPDAILNYLAWGCKIQCVFCYQKGHPPDFRGQKVRASFEEIETRLKYFSPQEGLALFEQTFHNIDEILNHPHIYEFLTRLRQKSNKPFILLTNGVSLTEERIKKMTELGPLLVPVSIHSTTPSLRRQLVNDKHPEIAINSPTLLSKYHIPYEIVVVRWPLIPFDDLRRTVHVAEAHQASMVRILLPGYSRYFPNEVAFNLEECWSETVRWVRTLREEVSVPIIVEPNLYEENHFEPEGILLPKIYGIIKNSPAYEAGLQRGDQIIEIEKIAIPYRADIVQHMYSWSEDNITSVNLKIKRGEKIFERKLEEKKSKSTYPHVPYVYPFGIMIGNGLGNEHIDKLYALIERHHAKKVLFLTSELIKPSLDQLLSKNVTKRPKDIEIFFESPFSQYFGGNIFMGDLLVVDDFVDYIKKWVTERAIKPDLVIIPSTPFFYYVGPNWLRDLCGKSYLSIERRIGIPVELIDCERIEGV